MFTLMVTAGLGQTAVLLQPTPHRAGHSPWNSWCVTTRPLHTSAAPATSGSPLTEPATAKTGHSADSRRRSLQAWPR
jgi:hypothetical protein